MNLYIYTYYTQCDKYVPGQGLKIIIETTICIFFDFIIQNILLWLQYTCYSDSIVIQMHVLAQFVELPLVPVWSWLDGRNVIKKASFQFQFQFWNNEKSQGAKSGEYGGWFNTETRFPKKSQTLTDNQWSVTRCIIMQQRIFWITIFGANMMNSAHQSL